MGEPPFDVLKRIENRNIATPLKVEEIGPPAERTAPAADRRQIREASEGLRPERRWLKHNVTGSRVCCYRHTSADQERAEI